MIRVSLYFLDGGYRADIAFGFYNALYKHPRPLYTKSTPSFIYFVATRNIEVKEMKLTKEKLQEIIQEEFEDFIGENKPLISYELAKKLGVGLSSEEEPEPEEDDDDEGAEGEEAEMP